MTDTKHLRDALARATKGDLATAEKVTADYAMECPVCCGEGEVDVKDYCNIDDKALGVQFYGVGHEFGAHEHLWTLVMRHLPGLLDEIDALKAERDALLNRPASDIPFTISRCFIKTREGHTWAEDILNGRPAVLDGYIITPIDEDQPHDD